MIISIALLSCTKAPIAEWVDSYNELQPPPKYVYVMGEGFSDSEKGAKDSAYADALRKACAASGEAVRRGAEVQCDLTRNKYEDICPPIAILCDYEYKAYTLIMYKQDFHASDQPKPIIKCGSRLKSSICSKVKRDPEIKTQLIELNQKTRDLEKIALEYEQEDNPKSKSEQWRKGRILHDSINEIQKKLSVNAPSNNDAESFYKRMHNSCLEYHKNSKMHWNPEQENIYSEIAFSKLSGGIKMEKSPCDDNGILLAYKNSEPECSMKFGLSTCYYTQTLSVAACDGTEYTQLKGDAMGAHQKPDFALEKLQNNLKTAEFWNKWIQEIKQWSPQCE